MLPAVARDMVYDAVAANRYKLFGQRDQCRASLDDKDSDRFLM